MAAPDFKDDAAWDLVAKPTAGGKEAGHKAGRSKEPPSRKEPLSGIDQRLLKACKDGDARSVEQFLAAGASADAVDAEGDSALQLSILRRNETCVKLLLNAGASTSSAAHNKDFPLHIALQDNHLGMVTALLDAKASPHPQKAKDGTTVVRSLFRLQPSFHSLVSSLAPDYLFHTS